MVWYGLEAEEYDRKYSDKELLRRILMYFKPYTKEMILVIILTIVNSFLMGLLPKAITLILNWIEGSLTTNISPMIIGIIGIFALNIVSFILIYFYSLKGGRVLNHIVYDLRQDLNRSVLDQDLSFYDKYPTGKIVSRVNSDTSTFGETAIILMDAVSSFFSVIVLTIPMLITDWRLGLVMIAMFPLVFVFTLSFRKVARKKTLQGQRSLAIVNAFVQESMTGIQIAKTFRQEHKLYKNFNEVNSQSFKVNLSRAFYMNLIFPGLTTISQITLSVILLLGGRFIVEGDLLGSDFYLFIQSLNALFFPIFSVAAFWPQFQVGLAAGERTFALIDSKPNVIQNDDLIREDFEGKVHFHGLKFHYIPEKPIFDEFELEIPSGESLAIVGHTGAGKTSLANLLLRFYEYQEGQIEVDDIDIRDFNLPAFRKQIGFIPQTPFLWADTLENNVRYGNEDATREQVQWALKQAGGSDWVEDLPEGLDTNIRERGKLLSMGQRQLVVFARVLLQDPSILVLDEATASVDPFTETRIQEAMERLTKGRTSIIIAHRLRTVRHVDRIIVLDHGKIVESGNHDNLMNQGGTYATLYNTYFKHQSFEYVEKKIE